MPASAAGGACRELERCCPTRQSNVRRELRLLSVRGPRDDRDDAPPAGGAEWPGKLCAHPGAERLSVRIELPRDAEVWARISSTRRACDRQVPPVLPLGRIAGDGGAERCR